MRKLTVALYVATLITSCNTMSGEQRVALERKHLDSLNAVIMAAQAEADAQAAKNAPNVCSEDIGVLQSDQDGHSIGNKTERQALAKHLKTGNCDIISIDYELHSSTYGNNIKQRLVYNRINRTLKVIFPTNDASEDYSNVDEGSLTSFLKSGSKSYTKISNYSKSGKVSVGFTEAKPDKPIGSKPQQSEWDGSVSIVKNYIKDNANDAESIRFIDWSKLDEYGKYWVVRCKYKGSNSFGGIVTNNRMFFIQNEKVVKSIDFNQIKNSGM